MINRDSGPGQIDSAVDTVEFDATILPQDVTLSFESDATGSVLVQTSVSLAPGIWSMSFELRSILLSII